MAVTSEPETRHPDSNLNQERPRPPANPRRPKDLDPLAGPDGGNKGRRLASFWLEHVIQCDDDKEFKRWLKRGTTIEKRYRDERNRVDEEGQRRYNALWTNVEILQPALYGKTPVPVCERRFRDKDPVGRGAAQMLERALRNEIEICGFDEAMRQALKDYLLAGRGTVWVRYEPKFKKGPSIPIDEGMDYQDNQGEIEEPDESEDEEKLEETGDRIDRESTPVDFVQWTDFYTFPSKARVWKEVTAVGKRVYMTREQLCERFGDEIGYAIPLQKDDRNVRRQEDTSVGHEIDEKAQVYEIWDRNHEEVIWVAEGYQYLCDRKDDPLELENFFPTPKPLYANPTNNTLVPVPDFIQYQDQAIQIDELTQRIAMLSKACKVAGVYNAAAKGIQRLFNESVENEMIPVDDWSAFAEGDGIAGNLSFIPLKEIMGVIEELTKVRQENITDMDRITGINDIMRGTTDARETLGGQRLKSNTTGTRLQARQNEVVRFATDTLRIMADIMCKHFSDESLIEVSGAWYEEGLGTTNPPDEDQLQKMLSQVTTTPAPPPSALSPPLAGGSPGPGGAKPPLGPPQPPGHFPPPGGAGNPMGGPPGPSPLPQGGPGGPPPTPNLPVPFKSPQEESQQAQQAAPHIPPMLLDHILGMRRINRAIKLLRDEHFRGFRVDIEVESTIYPDWDQEKQERTAFIAGVTKAIEQAMMVGVQMPPAIPLFAKLLQFGVRGFKVGRDLEQSIEDFSDEALEFAKQKASQASSQQNPQMLKAQADMLKAQSSAESSKYKIQSDKEKATAEIERQRLENQGEQANAQADLEQSKADKEIQQMEIEIKKIELQLQMIKMKTELEVEKQKAETAKQQQVMDQQKMHQEAALGQQEMQMKGQEMQHQTTQMHMQHQQAQEQHQMDRENMHMQRQQGQEQMQMQRENNQMQRESNQNQLQMEQHKTHQAAIGSQQQQNQSMPNQQPQQGQPQHKPKRPRPTV